MTHILTHVHLYYIDMWPEIKEKLANITVSYDLFVTLNNRNERLQQDILNFKNDAVIQIVDNRGFDVGPFIKLLNSVDLDQYDYIIKLHTKRNMPEGFSLQGYDMSFGKHRKYLMKFLESQNTFNRCLNAFDSDKILGMIGDFHIICRKDKSGRCVVKKGQELLKAAGFPEQEYPFILGTMFMVRAALFKPVLRLKLDFNDFTPSIRGHDILPYGLEAFFGFVIHAQRYEIKDVMTPRYAQICARFFALLSRLVYRKKVTVDGHVTIKLFKIPVFVRRNPPPPPSHTLGNINEKYLLSQILAGLRIRRSFLEKSFQTFSSGLLILR